MCSITNNSIQLSQNLSINNYLIHIIFEKGWWVMNKDKMNNKTSRQEMDDSYDDGNIPEIDLPQDIYPDEVPRKDGPGGESGD